jgi:hypothetical protein
MDSTGFGWVLVGWTGCLVELVKLGEGGSSGICFLVEVLCAFSSGRFEIASTRLIVSLGYMTGFGVSVFARICDDCYIECSRYVFSVGYVDGLKCLSLA